MRIKDLTQSIMDNRIERGDKWELISGCIRLGRRDFYQCPITSVHGDNTSSYVVLDAALELGLPANKGFAVAQAADNNVGTSRRRSVIRKAMLEACGLSR